MAAKEKKKEETFVEAANRLIKDMPDLESDPRIDRRVSPVTGAPSPRLGKAETNTSPESREAGGNQRSPTERQMTSADADITAGAPKATIIPEQADLTEKAIALFRHTHGGPFNPKSSMDKKKMAAIQGLLSQEGSDKLTPNQFALAIYRTTK